MTSLRSSSCSNFVCERMRSTRGIAAGLTLSPETVRKQLKAALAKTGCARNIDLAVLLATPASSIPAITQ